MFTTRVAPQNVPLPSPIAHIDYNTQRAIRADLSAAMRSLRETVASTRHNLHFRENAERTPNCGDPLPPRPKEASSISPSKRKAIHVRVPTAADEEGEVGVDTPPRFHNNNGEHAPHTESSRSVVLVTSPPVLAKGLVAAYNAKEREERRRERSLLEQWWPSEESLAHASRVGVRSPARPGRSPEARSKVASQVSTGIAGRDGDDRLITSLLQSKASPLREREPLKELVCLGSQVSRAGQSPTRIGSKMMKEIVFENSCASSSGVIRSHQRINVSPKPTWNKTTLTHNPVDVLSHPTIDSVSATLASKKKSELYGHRDENQDGGMSHRRKRSPQPPRLSPQRESLAHGDGNRALTTTLTIANHQKQQQESRTHSVIREKEYHRDSLYSPSGDGQSQAGVTRTASTFSSVGAAEARARKKEMIARQREATYAAIERASLANARSGVLRGAANDEEAPVVRSALVEDWLGSSSKTEDHEEVDNTPEESIVVHWGMPITDAHLQTHPELLHGSQRSPSRASGGEDQEVRFVREEEEEEEEEIVPHQGVVSSSSSKEMETVEMDGDASLTDDEGEEEDYERIIIDRLTSMIETVAAANASLARETEMYWRALRERQQIQEITATKLAREVREQSKSMGSRSPSRRPPSGPAVDRNESSYRRDDVQKNLSAGRGDVEEIDKELRRVNEEIARLEQLNSTLRVIIKEAPLA